MVEDLPLKDTEDKNKKDTLVSMFGASSNWVECELVFLSPCCFVCDSSVKQSFVFTQGRLL